MALFLYIPTLILTVEIVSIAVTDYSQLNHDEPTHWTKAATTHAPATSGLVVKDIKNSTVLEATPTAGSLHNDTLSTEDTQIYNSTLDDDWQARSSLEEYNDTVSTLANDSASTADSRDNVDLVTSQTENVSDPANTSVPIETITSPQRKLDAPTTEISTGSLNYDDVDDKASNTVGEHYYRYDVMDEMKKNYNSVDNDLLEKQDLSDIDIERALTSFRREDHDSLNYDIKAQTIPKYDYNSPDGFDSEQEEEEIRREDTKVNKPKPASHKSASLSDLEESYDVDTPFRKWDRDSEEQEKMLENIVFQANNDTLDKIEIESSDSSDEQTGTGRWFLLLLAGNSTIVRLRQKDFAKYLKLNLAARLSLEYDEVKLNKVRYPYIYY